MQEKILSCGQLLGLLSLAKGDLDKLSHGSAVRSGIIKSAVWQYQFYSSPYSLSLSRTQISKNNCLCSLNDLFWFKDNSSQNRPKECNWSDAWLPVASLQDQSLQEGARRTWLSLPNAGCSSQGSKTAHVQPVARYIPLTCTLSGSRTLALRAPLYEGRAGNSAAIWNIFKIGLIVMTQSLLDFLWN